MEATLNPETMKTQDGKYLLYKPVYLKIDWIDNPMPSDETSIGICCTDLKDMEKRVKAKVAEFRKDYPLLGRSAKIRTLGHWETPADIFSIGVGPVEGSGQPEFGTVTGFLVDVMPKIREQLRIENGEQLERLRRGYVQG